MRLERTEHDCPSTLRPRPRPGDGPALPANGNTSLVPFCEPSRRPQQAIQSLLSDHLEKDRMNGRRHARGHSCRVCGGYKEIPRGEKRRCAGFTDGNFVFCTREEFAGKITSMVPTVPPTYRHSLTEECDCGTKHSGQGGSRQDEVPRPPVRRNLVAEYEYRDPLTGEVVAVHERFEATVDSGAKPTKDMPWKLPGGIWKNGIKSGFPTGFSGLPLYHASLILMAAPESEVFFCEGEKATDVLQAKLSAAGSADVAVANPGGASQVDFGRSLDILANQRLTRLPDNDADGTALMHRVYEQLLALGCDVRWVDVSELPAEGDAVEFFQHGRSLDDLRAKVVPVPPLDGRAYDSSAPRESARANGILSRIQSAQELSRIVPEDIDFIVRPIIVRGALTELLAKPKIGKTTWLLALSRAAVDGRRFIWDETAKTKVLFLTEQPWASFAAALRRVGLDTSEDFFVLSWSDSRDVAWPRIVEGAVNFCVTYEVALLIVDTLPQFAQMSGDAENSAGAALEAMAPLQEAASHGIGVAYSRHDRKSGGRD